MSYHGSRTEHQTQALKDRLKLENDAEQRPQSRSEKRKSEVLIAAQSLDSELQHVKNLKRISIGSMDMLIDPEMEFRVSPTKSHSSPSEDSLSVESQTDDDHNEIRSIDGEDDNEFSYMNDDSIDITSTEYLQESGESAVNQTSSSGRSLRGVRRGGFSSQPRLNENTISMEMGDSVTQNLLWVPANQHPSVKPENYLELIQDTLHTLKIDPDNESSSSHSVTPQSASKATAHSNQLRSGPSTLVRRPSGLRKSYTELEDLLQHELENNNENHETFTNTAKTPDKIHASSKLGSLRDITEELTRISNRAGFTDSDAVSLARTLSMASSYNGQEPEFNSSQSTELPENEYASSMLTKNGLAIPARSSLRRSKFNTYRVRTSSGNSVSPSKLGTTTVDRKEPPESLPQIADTILQSPGSFNDFNEIYDHYRQSSLEGAIDMQSPDHKESAAQNVSKKESGIQILNDNNSASKDAWVEKKHLEPKENHTKLKRDGNKQQQDGLVPRKKSGWNWFNKRTTKDQEITKNDESKLSNDFLNIKDNETKIANRPIEKINHSRHRHYRAEDSVVNETTENNSVKTVTNTSSSKKQKREKKFIQLFRRNRSSSTGNRDRDESTNVNEIWSGGLHDVLRTRASSANLASSTRRKSRKGSRGSSDEDYESIGGSSVSSFDHDSKRNTCEPIAQPITKLQPSVTLTPKIRPAVTAKEVTPDKPSPISSESEKNSSLELANEAGTESKPDFGGRVDKDVGLNPKEDALAVQQSKMPEDESPNDASNKSFSTDVLAGNDEGFVTQSTKADKTATLAAPAAGGYILPDRKLTFGDVVKPEKPNAPMVFSDSSFGFPLPPLTVSTVVMIDQRLPINVERAIYRLSHLKLGDPKRELRQQVVLSNFMYAYLNLVNHSLYLQQLEEENVTETIKS
ncbi:LANO_0F13960g1_1 [Lachancea nothofagi CBS 11611]|uniref:LANO_0F13960g1_1 n=1 Tax=Lachancea nothofagi CBS 11611 TaxID=1266666 RepID=A0A1G4KCA1_9SACH|nr:LANO_0F13960g1_1 [Lachancea nothofagi CBS 11611]